jgi:hypothetical protein
MCDFCTLCQVVQSFVPPVWKLSAFLCHMEISEILICFLSLFSVAIARPLDGLRRLMSSVGILVCWYTGILVYWYIGMLVYWYTGILVCWYIGVLVDWYIGILVDWYIGILVYWYAGILVYW